MSTDFERARVRRRLRAELFGKKELIERIGRFDVLELIGMGASSHVYMGRDPDLDRHVAIKVMHNQGVSDAMRGRLTREGRALARLSHPNVLRIYEIGTHKGDVFLAVELVEGQDLASWLREAPQSWTDVVSVMRDAGAGLAAAHELDLVHRDVKPANVLIDAKGHVRVADFGLVQHFGESETSPSASDDFPAVGSSITRTGALVGSPAYMAPEQWIGGLVDARTDQFGFCVTFHEALHGERPFRADTEQELAEAICTGRLAPSQDHDVPLWLDAIVERGLLPKPEDRYASMNALLADLDRKTKSHMLVQAAKHEIEKLDASDDPARFARHGASAHVAFTEALQAWPEHVAAKRGRDALLERLLDDDLAQGTIESAARRLIELGSPPVLALRVERARQAAEQTESNLAKLAAIEHDDDPYVSLSAKLRALLVQGPIAALAMVGLGETHRRGWAEVGLAQLCALFTLYLTVSYVVSALKKKVFYANRNTRLLVELGMMNIGGAALMFGFGAWLDVPTWEALLFVQVMRATFWFAGGVYIDRRLHLIAFIAILAAVAMRFFPNYAIDIFGVSAGIGLTLLAWRTLADAPDAEDGTSI